MASQNHKTNPFIPKPAKREEPSPELLTHESTEHRLPIPMKQDVPMLFPNFNDLYDTYRSRGAWRYSADGYANGTITTVANTAVSTAVSLTLPANTQSPNWRLEQWPGGTLLYLVIRYFSIGPQTASFATAGAITCVFVDQFGNNVPLGVVPNNNFFSSSTITIVPGAITDSGQQVNLGQLVATLNSGATVGTYAWQIGFSVAYLIPAIKGYKLERIGNDTNRYGGTH